MVSTSMRPINITFVNNYCKEFDNLKLDEDRYLNAVGRPIGFQSDARLSRQLAYVLRHGGNSDGFELQPGGFIDVEKLLKHRRFRDKCNVEDLRRIVAQDAKQRYLLRQDPHTGVLQIRANHGHTIPVEDDGTLLQKITREHGITEATHRTSSSAWMAIRREGLSRMRRNHIHMVPDGKADLSNPHLASKRQNLQILIVVNVWHAMFDGIEFFRSRNGILLSPGDSRGFISPMYFKRVINVRTGENLLEKPLSTVVRGGGGPTSSTICNQQQKPLETKRTVAKQPFPKGKGRKLLDTSDKKSRCTS